jgi:hypothetical protein
MGSIETVVIARKTTYGPVNVGSQSNTPPSAPIQTPMVKSATRTDDDVTGPASKYSNYEKERGLYLNIGPSIEDDAVPI